MAKKYAAKRSSSRYGPSMTSSARSVPMGPQGDIHTGKRTRDRVSHLKRGGAAIAGTGQDTNELIDGLAVGEPNVNIHPANVIVVRRGERRSLHRASICMTTRRLPIAISSAQAIRQYLARKFFHRTCRPSLLQRQ
ncbi:protein of unknown function (plasmid) [Cupriavidus taiwanensis]|uniref:Uncharacterized protein n=1 Tax=Cupriavidus taiwanensis TaxID=164546 RepID=A0A375FI16_9BURK|nr:protein of unknown function [Cupriavidus taiwanensis]SOZ72503.1 protein of unknown function [Cupriavidus taiwanensis]SOZ74955.1 protein of unknown function [Cupriavidus taiwanensis]SPA03367.1 protein of unknown function [Cupriavidus taiwanensis]SPA11732.1 protein of unknown function [Cupriavidus taiwanensis]